MPKTTTAKALLPLASVGNPLGVRRQAGRGGLVVGMALLLNGCSVALLQRPPAGEGPLRAGSCDTSRYVPTIDVLAAAAGAALFVFVPSEESLSGDASLVSRYGSATMPGDVLWDDAFLRFSNKDRILVGLGSAVYIGSAVLGFNAVAECRRRVIGEEEVAAHLRRVR